MPTEVFVSGRLSGLCKYQPKHRASNTGLYHQPVSVYIYSSAPSIDYECVYLHIKLIHDLSYQIDSWQVSFVCYRTA